MQDDLRSAPEETGDKQTPWESSSLVGDFYFSGDGSMQIDELEPNSQPGSIAG